MKGGVIVNNIPKSDYIKWSKDISGKIKRAQLRTALKVNSEMLQLYWEIGFSVLDVQKRLGWGGHVISNLAQDIKKDFPDSTGYSVRNLNYMRTFAEAYPDYPFLNIPLSRKKGDYTKIPLDKITWFQHISLIGKVKNIKERAFYITESSNNGWNTEVMLMQIASGLYRRSGKAINNFSESLPDYQSDLAQSIFKDPYKFGFLNLTRKVKEYEIEQKLTEKLSDFLIELGKGFAFVGRQYGLEVDGTEYKIDLLFYHTILHCYIVIELKAGEFMPEYISKLNFYISAVDDILKSGNDKPTIGLLLCASKSNIKVEYAMRGMKIPLGVAAYEIEELIKNSLPEKKELKQLMVREIEAVYGSDNDRS